VGVRVHWTKVYPHPDPPPYRGRECIRPWPRTQHRNLVLMSKRILVTGAAGFIGMHTALKLAARGDEVIGVDNFNSYYDVGLKQARAKELEKRGDIAFETLDMADAAALEGLFKRHQPTHVINLAAQPGVRYALTNPQSYLASNLTGFGNVLECCRNHAIQHLVYASSSSVYGANTKMPFAETDAVDHPISLYAATKKSNELMAHAYAHLFRLPCSGLRFFTVYGPWGRPDMAVYLFTKAIFEGRPIQIFNNGLMQRDFTFIDDIVAGVIGVLDRPATADPAFSAGAPSPAISNAPWRVFNIGNNRCEPLLHFVDVLEEACGRKAIREFLPMQAGDVPATYADISALNALTGYEPTTSIDAGLPLFVKWFRRYHKL
jgi:UDP-glucuronate 4-epimerase